MGMYEGPNLGNSVEGSRFGDWVKGEEKEKIGDWLIVVRMVLRLRVDEGWRDPFRERSSLLKSSKHWPENGGQEGNVGDIAKQKMLWRYRYNEEISLWKVHYT